MATIVLAYPSRSSVAADEVEGSTWEQALRDGLSAAGGPPGERIEVRSLGCGTADDLGPSPDAVGSRRHLAERLFTVLGEAREPVILTAVGDAGAVAYAILAADRALSARLRAFVTVAVPFRSADLQERLGASIPATPYPPDLAAWLDVRSSASPPGATAGTAQHDPTRGRRVRRIVLPAVSGSQVGSQVHEDVLAALRSPVLGRELLRILDAGDRLATANGGPREERPVGGRPVAANGGPREEPAGDRPVAANGGPLEEAAGDGGPSPTRTVERVASADFPPIVAPGSEHFLLFAIGKRAVFGTSTGLTVTVPAATREVTIKVVVYAPAFTVLNDAGEEQSWAELTVDVTEEGGATAKGQLLLRATDAARRTTTSIHVRFYHGTLPAGQLELATVIDPKYVAPGASVRLSLGGAREPDYVFVITDADRRVRGKGPFDIRVSREARYIEKELGRIEVNVASWELARSILKQFKQVSLAEDPDERIERAEDIGLALWDELPAKFKSLYWEELHDQPDLSIAIYSAEPYIPWELVKPRTEDRTRVAPFLGVSYSMARWKQARPFPDPFVVDAFTVIAPDYVPPSLPDAKLEANDLVERYGATIVPGTSKSVRALLKSDKTRIVHFAGHGRYDPSAADASAIKLVDGSLAPNALQRATLGLDAHPLVFLNACEVGRQGWSLTQIGGWADAFCDAGFSAFVGPYWAVIDKVSRKAANLFYEELVRGATVGEAIRAIRRRFYDDDEYRGHPSWLAYTLHCQPNVHIDLRPAHR